MEDLRIMINQIDLTKFSFFSGIPDSYMNDIIHHFRMTEVKKRQQLSRTKDMEDAVYFVYEGLVKISYFSETGKEYIFSILKEGDMHSFHSAAVAYALTDCLVATIPMDSFKKILMDFPFLNFRMYKILGGVLKKYNDLVLNLVFKNVSSRLAHYLLEYFTDNNWNTLNLTVEELACHLGTTRQTVSTTLNHWERQGYIELIRGGIRILNRDFIQKIVINNSPISRCTYE
jgi:CRP-like cAMP-binding protein